MRKLIVTVALGAGGAAHNNVTTIIFPQIVANNQDTYGAGPNAHATVNASCQAR
jgi:hypothetical protein